MWLTECTYSLTSGLLHINLFSTFTDILPFMDIMGYPGLIRETGIGLLNGKSKKITSSSPKDFCH